MTRAAGNHEAVRRNCRQAIKDAQKMREACERMQVRIESMRLKLDAIKAVRSQDR